MRRRYLPAGVAAVALLLTWVLWPVRRPNVVLISIDALRPDFLSCYGGGHAPTPNIDAVAAAGVTFTDAMAAASWERASVATLLTGRYSGQQGLRSLFDRLPETKSTMAAVLTAAGYRTGAVVSDFDLDHIFRLDQGFDSYDDRYAFPFLGLGVERVLHRASIFYGDFSQDRTFRRLKLAADSRRNDAA